MPERKIRYFPPASLLRRRRVYSAIIHRQYAPIFTDWCSRFCRYAPFHRKPDTSFPRSLGGSQTSALILFFPGSSSMFCIHTLDFWSGLLYLFRGACFDFLLFVWYLQLEVFHALFVYLFSVNPSTKREEPFFYNSPLDQILRVSGFEWLGINKPICRSYASSSPFQVGVDMIYRSPLLCQGFCDMLVPNLAIGERNTCVCADSRQ